jgi:hypothetical protein
MAAPDVEHLLAGVRRGEIAALDDNVLPQGLASLRAFSVGCGHRCTLRL